MSHDSQIIYKKLLDRHERILIPMIQRDFAQGRSSESTVRELFLMALSEALCKPIDDPTLPLNLDFIYGSVEGREETRFLPLDGQQRLTTLFLLHWYLAWRDEKWADFEAMFLDGKKAKFSYDVRPSSNEFFDQLVIYRPSLNPEDVTGIKQPISTLITDQPWYFRSWRLDPTIQSVLLMLDAIHEKFVSSSGLFARLIDENHPAITFQLLDLKDFGLSDDLYIKMNARGKPLTPFETFKARYEEKLKNQLNGAVFSLAGHPFSVADYVAQRMDTAWADLFWKLRDPKSHQFDQAFMNLARTVALVTRNPDDENYLDDVNKLRSTREGEVPSYTDFHSRGWLDDHFTLTIIHLLDAWSRESGNLSCFLPDNSLFDERLFFDKIALNRESLSYAEVVQFAGYVAYIDKYHDSIDSAAFQEWMRIIFNLSTNTIYNRVEDFRRSIRGLNGLLENADDILRHFAQAESVTSGFYEPQIAEETLKAKLILADNHWRKLIDQAERHGYFRGQIWFLLDFCGAVTDTKNLNPSLWDTIKHTTNQVNFERYVTIAEKTFSASGLVDDGRHCWQRAFLSYGDYLLPRGSNLSFLVNTVTDETSWKRLLRGTGTNPEPREFLKQLWDQLHPNEDLMSQLDGQIDADHKLEPWRTALIHCPEAFDYCEKNYIRKESQNTIYLLRRTQLNGFHADLFTYCLYIELKDTFKILQPSYLEVPDKYTEPCFNLKCNNQDKYVSFSVFSDNGGYRIQIAMTDCSEIVGLENALEGMGYSVIDDVYQNLLNRSDIKSHLKVLDEALELYKVT
ncbi:MAG TPA: DUF262 domain-containing protein [Dehalococcoidia bacterium]|nr:DUF262 domain-containing protein [Dehalococcoidia bacterium]